MSVEVTEIGNTKVPLPLSAGYPLGFRVRRGGKGKRLPAVGTSNVTVAPAAIGVKIAANGIV
jgi:hypothetical protein